MRVIYLVDGFNLYHSLDEASKHLGVGVKLTGVIFPYNRKNNDLARVANFSFQAKPAKYMANQFDDPYTDSFGGLTSKPVKW